MNHFQCFLLLAFSFLPIQSFVEAKTNGFTIDLIHPDSPLSPFYNQSLTPMDLARYDVLRSLARINHFRQPSNKIDSLDENKIESEVFPVPGTYLMKLYIGTPPVEVLAIADTGSDLVWIQCTPCQQCYPQNLPLFNSMQSSTYMQLSCDSSYCQILKEKTCGNQNNECKYKYGYGDNSYTLGVLSTDTFTFDSTDGQTTGFPNSVFGCGNNNGGRLASTHASGLVGLGGGSLSLISQLGAQIEYKFSYCLLPRTAKSASKLRFGTNAAISGGGVVSTPLLPRSDDNYYHLNLEGVSVGGKKIVNTQAGSGEGNIIIDSGTTLTLLEPSFYSDVEAAIKESVGLNSVQDPNGNYKLCYDETALSSISEVTMVFHFSGADVELKTLNIFQEFNGIACLAMLPDNRISIYGNVAQMNFRVEYDLANKQVSFAPADCTQF